MLNRAARNAVLPGKITFPAAVAPGQNKVDDDPRKLGELLSLFKHVHARFCYRGTAPSILSITRRDHHQNHDQHSQL